MSYVNDYDDNDDDDDNDDNHYNVIETYLTFNSTIDRGPTFIATQVTSNFLGTAQANLLHHCYFFTIIYLVSFFSTKQTGGEFCSLN
jgi:hypothetical protein